MGLPFLWEKNYKFNSLNKLSFEHVYEILPITDESLKNPTSFFRVPTTPSSYLYY